jgi:hypothetical protein
MTLPVLTHSRPSRIEMLGLTSYLAIFVLLLSSCGDAPRAFLAHDAVVANILVQVREADRLVAEMQIPESGGPGFAVIDRDTIIVLECPFPKYDPGALPVYADFTTTIMEHRIGGVQKSKLVSTFTFGGRDKLIGPVGKFMVSVTFPDESPPH